MRAEKKCKEGFIISSTDSDLIMHIGLCMCKYLRGRNFEISMETKFGGIDGILIWLMRENVNFGKNLICWIPKWYDTVSKNGIFGGT